MTLLIENLPGLLAVRTVLATLLLFFLPGWAITFALLPTHPFGLIERLLLAIGTSVSVAIVGGLLLNLPPWGLQATSWAVLLTGITLVATVIAWLRLRNRQGEAVMSVAAIAAYGRTLGADLRLTTWQTLLLALAVLVGSVAWSLAVPRRRPKACRAIPCCGSCPLMPNNRQPFAWGCGVASLRRHSID